MGAPLLLPGGHRTTIGGRPPQGEGSYEPALERAYFPRLRERRKQAAGTMSGGEQQMLVVARAL